jgi:hypothetical protein
MRRTHESQRGDEATENQEREVRADDYSAGTVRHSRPADRLHRAGGNRAVQRLHEEGELRAKLRVGRPDDRFEREADRVARAVTEPSPPTSVPDLAVRRSASTETTPLEAPLEREVRSLRRGGRSLPASTRATFESRLGHDFGDVRVHTGSRADEAARAIDAQAFTLGTDVFFARGNYRPNTPGGRKLLAHELTHVVQQSRDGPAIQRQMQNDWALGDLDEDARKRLTVLPDLPADVVDFSAWTDSSQTLSNVEYILGQNVDGTLGERLARIGGELVSSGNLGTNTTRTIRADVSAISEFDDDAIEPDRIVVRFTHFQRSGSDDGLLIENLGSYDARGTSTEGSLSDEFDVEVNEESWDDSELAVFRTALELIPDDALGPIEGVKFKPGRGNSDAAAEYSDSDHTIAVWDKLFEESVSVYGPTGSGYVSNSVRRIVHELAHAIDYESIVDWRREKARLKKKEAKLKKEKTKLERFGDIGGGPFDDSESDSEAKEERSVEDVEKELGKVWDEMRALDDPEDVVRDYSKAGKDFPEKMAEDAPSGASDTVPITDYAGDYQGSSDDEYRLESFAEAYSLYLTAPGWLMEIRPAVYEFFDTHDVLAAD